MDSMLNSIGLRKSSKTSSFSGNVKRIACIVIPLIAGVGSRRYSYVYTNSAEKRKGFLATYLNLWHESARVDNSDTTDTFCSQCLIVLSP